MPVPGKRFSNRLRYSGGGVLADLDTAKVAVAIWYSRIISFSSSFVMNSCIKISPLENSNVGGQAPRKHMQRWLWTLLRAQLSHRRAMHTQSEHTALGNVTLSPILQFAPANQADFLANRGLELGDGYRLHGGYCGQVARACILGLRLHARCCWTSNALLGL
ncbi:hypothetical protein KCU79_g140, partial [Aureobasidium melanogenum]